MNRRLFNVLAAVSLVLCVATGALWIRCFLAFDNLHFVTSLQREYIFFSARGGIYVGAAEYIWKDPIILDADDERPPCWNLTWCEANSVVTIPQRHGSLGQLLLHWKSERDEIYRFYSGLRVRGVMTNRGLIIPHWMLVLTFAMVPVIRVRGALRRRLSRTEKCCRSCGYDLRASPGRCPECGTTPAEANA